MRIVNLIFILDLDGCFTFGGGDVATVFGFPGFVPQLAKTAVTIMMKHVIVNETYNTIIDF